MAKSDNSSKVAFYYIIFIVYIYLFFIFEILYLWPYSKKKKRIQEIDQTRVNPLILNYD